MTNKTKKPKTPWPTKDAMVQIYENHLWGGSEHLFYSGDGSHEEHLVTPWLQVVQDFLSSFKRPISICDLGCGDFNVGKQLLPYCSTYTAVDIVPDLIAHHRQEHIAPNLNFQCLDIAKDVLPVADCAILRQVLQHVSNEEISAITQKLVQYKYVIITEHLPEGVFVPNIDIISGQGIRLKIGSGVDVLQPPFSLPVTSAEQLLEVIPRDGKGRIVTWLFFLT